MHAPSRGNLPTEKNLEAVSKALGRDYRNSADRVLGSARVMAYMVYGENGGQA